MIVHHRNLNLKTESAQHASLHPKFRWFLQKFWGPAVPRITGVQPNPQTWVDQVSGTSVQRRLQCEVRILPLVDGGKPAARSTGIPLKKNTRKHPWKEYVYRTTPFLGWQWSNNSVLQGCWHTTFIWHFGDDEQGWPYCREPVHILKCKALRHECINIYVYAYLNIYIYTYTDMKMYVYTYLLYKHIIICVCVQMYIYINKYIHIHICMYVCMCIYTCISMHI